MSKMAISQRIHASEQSIVDTETRTRGADILDLDDDGLPEVIVNAGNPRGALRHNTLNQVRRLTVANLLINPSIAMILCGFGDLTNPVVPSIIGNGGGGLFWSTRPDTTRGSVSPDRRMVSTSRTAVEVTVNAK
jgi:hypothetical protein